MIIKVLASKTTQKVHTVKCLFHVSLQEYRFEHETEEEKM